VTPARFTTTVATALIAVFILTSALIAQSSDPSRYWASGEARMHRVSRPRPTRRSSGAKPGTYVSGILTAVDARTGTPHYQNQRLNDVPNVFASPVSARGRIYFPGREGTTLVIKSGPTFEILAKNTLDDGFDASPALVDNEIYLRGYRHLYAIAQP
jgi:hypothetical protein